MPGRSCPRIVISCCARGRPLCQSMQTLLTGSIGSFNRRHQRSGHLLQNRDKSIPCEEDPSRLELMRSIHLNPVRGGLVLLRAAAALDLAKDKQTVNVPVWAGVRVSELSEGLPADPDHAL